MRKLRHLSLVVVLIFAFATSGLAGIMPTVPGPEAPPSPPSSQAVNIALVLLRVLAL